MSRPIELRITDGRMAFGDVPDHIDERLQAAVQARHDAALCETLLWEAHRMGPRVLPVYFALYKFYFSRRRFDEAERVARIGLDAAAQQLGLPPDWRRFDPAGTDWTCEGPQRFALFTLKALAFITLRRGRVPEATAILAKLAALDPTDQIGHGTVAAIAKGLEGEE